jgi:hypothetical protein
MWVNTGVQISLSKNSKLHEKNLSVYCGFVGRLLPLQLRGRVLSKIDLLMGTKVLIISKRHNSSECVQ